MATILIAILLLTESVVADQGLASREYKAATVERSESEDRYLFCNTSASSKQCKSPWLTGCIVLKKTATTATCGLTIFSCATILLD